LSTPSILHPPSSVPPSLPRNKGVPLCRDIGDCTDDRYGMEAESSSNTRTRGLRARFALRIPRPSRPMAALPHIRLALPAFPPLSKRTTYDAGRTPREAAQRTTNRLPP